MTLHRLLFLLILVLMRLDSAFGQLFFDSGTNSVYGELKYEADSDFDVRYRSGFDLGIGWAFTPFNVHLYVMNNRVALDGSYGEDVTYINWFYRLAVTGQLSQRRWSVVGGPLASFSERSRFRYRRTSNSAEDYTLDRSIARKYRNAFNTGYTIRIQYDITPYTKLYVGKDELFTTWYIRSLRGMALEERTLRVGFQYFPRLK